MKNAILMHMGNRLAERRQQFGMTQEQLRDTSLTPEEWEFLEGIVQECVAFIRAKR